jgi:N-acetylmuramoyl-L-alanine amidase
MPSKQAYALLDNRCEYAPSPNTNGKRSKPTTLIVMHYTASASLAGSVAWLCGPQAKASAHFVVDRDGRTAQLLDTDAVGWHAGQSSWGGQPGVNSFSVGIELVNLGPLLVKTDGSYVSASGSRVVPEEDVFHGKHNTDAGCPYIAWQKYTAPQLERAAELIRLLRAKYPTVAEIVGHQDVAPKRKLDPSPAFVSSGLLSYKQAH